jgi:nucleoside 2-deoxyribosyltransferase
MKAYIAIKYHADHANRDRIEGITAVLESFGAITYCVTRDVEQWGTVSLTPDELMDKSFKLIDACDMMVVDLTEKGVGVGIEVGYAYAKGIPIITIARSNTLVSKTLRGISTAVLKYECFSDLEDAFVAVMH